MKKHIVCHIHCLDHPNVLKLIKIIKKYKEIFDLRIATITNSNKTICKQVKRILEDWDFKVFVVDNSLFREVEPFFNYSLPYLLENASEDDLMYFCHSKGVTYYQESERLEAINMWIDVMVDRTLEHVDQIPFEDTRYSAFGTFREQVGGLFGGYGELFHYVGTFYWIKINKLIGVPYDENKYYLEALPGLLMSRDEGYSIPPDKPVGKDPYRKETWEGVLNGL